MTEVMWEGVMPAITTPFKSDMSVDHEFLARHCAWMIDHGSTGIIPTGSLGESATLDLGEKKDVWRTCVESAGEIPIIPGIASLSTSEGVRMAENAREVGCRGIMVLPPYVHKGEWREIGAHFSAVIGATDLPCMLYNNPIAYGTDVSAEQVAMLGDAHENLRAVKESSGDSRRITALKALLGDRMAIFAGLDDLIVEGVAAGAVGWVAGLVNAMPAESVELFNRARNGLREEAMNLYSWFLPLLRLDTHPKFVQYIKLVQQEVGMGCETVRPPRMILEGAERDEVLELIRRSIADNPMGQ